MRTRPLLLAPVLLLTLVGTTVVAAPAFAAAPTITSFSPSSGKLLTTVTVTGTGFVAPATVSFAGVAATSATVSSATTIVTQVPAGARTGPLTVTTSGGSVTSTASFTVVPGMAISPTVGPPTTTVTVRFSGFSAYEGVDAYLDSTDVALVSADGNGTASTTLTVPASASPGTHWISVVGRHSGYSAQQAFLVRTDSPFYGATTNRRGLYAHENVLNTGAVSGLGEAWHSAGHGSTGVTPAIVGGVVYDGFDDGTLAAYDETTGALKWQLNGAQGRVSSSPAVAGGVLYVGYGNGALWAYTASTGAALWHTAIGSVNTGSVIFSSPVIANGIVYVGGGDGALYSLTASTGAIRWKVATPAGIISSPALYGGLVYIGSGDGTVRAVDATTGAAVWTYTTSNFVYASPVVVDGLVFVGSGDGNLYALNARTGTSRWVVNAGGQVSTSVTVAGGYVYLGTQDSHLLAIGEASGTIAWAATLPGAVSSDTTAADGVVYVSDTYNVYALAASNGTLVATLPTEYRGHAVVVDGTVTFNETATASLVHYTLDSVNAAAVTARPDVATLRPTIGR